MKCELCDNDGKIHIHHKDSNHDNNEPDNRIALCPKCHRGQHAFLYMKRGQRELPLDWSGIARLPHNYIREQYFKCFPRV